MAKRKTKRAPKATGPSAETIKKAVADIQGKTTKLADVAKGWGIHHLAALRLLRSHGLPGKSPGRPKGGKKKDQAKPTQRPWQELMNSEGARLVHRIQHYLEMANEDINGLILGGYIRYDPPKIKN